MTNSISYPKFKAWDSNGVPLAGGKLYSYSAGTSTPAATYSDSGLTVPNTNPVILDSVGEATVYLSTLGTKLVLKDSGDVLQWEADEVQAESLWTFSPAQASILYSSVLYGGTQAAIESALTVVGSTEATLYLAPANWIVSSNLIIPANVTLKPERGAILIINSGVTLTISGSFEAGIYQVLSCLGTGKVLFANGSCEKIPIEWFGAVGDATMLGVGTDCTSAIAAATNAAQGQIPVYFPGDLYLVTDQLSITAERYKWVGKRTERGCNAAGQEGPTYSATGILFYPADPTKWLVRRARYTNLTGYIGPFEHENLSFFLVGNGFEFGDRTDPTVTDGAFQSYVSNVRFSKCAATGISNTFTGKTFTRNGNVIIWLTKCFESTIEDISLFRGDTQIILRGCDTPTLRNIRSQGGVVPIHAIGSGTFTVDCRIDNLQVEGWGIGAVINDGVKMHLSNIRLEETYTGASGMGKYLLTAVTATATAGSPILVFSESMDNVLFPESILEFTLGGITYNARVLSVSGVNVTLEATALAADTYSFVVPASGAVTNIYRIHGYGIMSDSNHATNFVNGTIEVADSTPSFVYVANRGSMNIANATTEAGSIGNVNSMVIGNRLLTQSYLNQKMSFTNCSPMIIADPNHPMVFVDNWGQNRSLQISEANNRTIASQLFENLSQIRRAWTFTPKGTNTSNNNSHRIIFERVAGNGYADTLVATNEQVWAWRLGDTLYLIDSTLPTSAAKWFRLTIRARAVSTPGNLLFSYLPAGMGSTVIPVGTSWRTYELIFQCPYAWYLDPSGSDRGLRFQRGDTPEIYLAGAVVEELPDKPDTEAASVPTAGTYKAGMRVWKPAGAGSGVSPGWVCTASGTFSAATDNTGDTDGSTPVITGMADTSDFFVGQFVSVSAGFATTGPFEVLAKTSTTMTVDTNSNAAQNNVTVNTPDPVFAAMPNMP